MKMAHTATMAAALIAALAVAWKAPGFIGESPQAQANHLIAPHSPATEPNRKFVPRVGRHRWAHRHLASGAGFFGHQ